MFPKPKLPLTWVSLIGVTFPRNLFHFCVQWHAEFATTILNAVLKYLEALSGSWGLTLGINLAMPSTFKTGVVVAVSTWHIIPSVTMLGSKSVNTVFVFPVVRLLWGPEPKTTYFFVCPHKGALHTSVIESNPRSLSVVTVLNVDIFFLIVNRYQIGTHRRTVWLSGQPRGACTTCEVTVATKITPSWLANICDEDIKRLCSLEIPTHLVP